MVVTAGGGPGQIQGKEALDWELEKSGNYSNLKLLIKKLMVEHSKYILRSPLGDSDRS